MTATRAKRYQRYRIGLHIAGLAVSAAFLAAYQFLGISSYVADASLARAGSFPLALAAYFSVFSITYAVLLLPLDFLGGYVLEHRFSVSNQSLRRWASETLKQAALSFVMALLLVEVLYAVAGNAAGLWWLAVALSWLFFSIGLATIFPVIIIPLFYRYMPLSDESLRGRILALAGKFRIRILDISMIDFSKNTRKSNAAVVGWGRTRRIILTDNLVAEFTADEVETVVAHEMAHYAHNHIRKLLVIQAAGTLVFFYALSRVLPFLAVASGAEGAFDMAAFPLIVLLYGAYEFLVTPLTNAYSRRLERDADRGALDATGNAPTFISLMKRLAEKNISDVDPDPVIEYLFYTHPPISKRISMAEQYQMVSK